MWLQAAYCGQRLCSKQFHFNIQMASDRRLFTWGWFKGCTDRKHLAGIAYRRSPELISCLLRTNKRKPAFARDDISTEIIEKYPRDFEAVSEQYWSSRVVENAHVTSVQHWCPAAQRFSVKRAGIYLPLGTHTSRISLPVYCRRKNESTWFR